MRPDELNTGDTLSSRDQTQTADFLRLIQGSKIQYEVNLWMGSHESWEGCVLVETVGELIVSNYAAESINN